MNLVWGGHSVLDEFRQHFGFRFKPVVEGAAAIATMRSPKAVGTLLDLPLHLEMFFKGEFGLGANQGWWLRAIAAAGGGLCIHGSTSMIELSEP